MTNNKGARVDNLENLNWGYELEKNWDAMEKDGDGK